MKAFCTVCGVVESNDERCPVCRKDNLKEAGYCEVCNVAMEINSLENGLCGDCSRKRDNEELSLYRAAKAEGRLFIRERLYAGKTSFRINTRVKVISSIDTQLVGVTGRIAHPCMEQAVPGEEYVAALREENGKTHNLKASDYLVHYRACPCGSEQFTAHQLCRHDVVVDNEGNFESDAGIYDSERPYGPFGCVRCGREYSSLEDLDADAVPFEGQPCEEGQMD